MKHVLRQLLANLDESDLYYLAERLSRISSGEECGIRKDRAAQQDTTLESASGVGSSSEPFLAVG